VTRRSRASEGYTAGATAAARRELTCSVGGKQRQVRRRGEGRRTRTDGRPPVVVTGSAAEGRVGGPTAVEESSTGGDLVGDSPAHDEGSTEGGLVGDPPALDECCTKGGLVGDAPVREEGSTGGDLVGDPPAHDEGSTEGGLVGDLPALDECCTKGGLVGDPPVFAEGSTDRGSCARLAAQTAVRQVRGAGRHARRRAVHVRVCRQGRRGPHQVGGGQGGEDRDGGLAEQAGRNPNAADRHAGPMEGGQSGGGMGRSAAA